MALVVNSQRVATMSGCVGHYSKYRLFFTSLQRGRYNFLNLKPANAAPISQGSLPRLTHSIYLTTNAQQSPQPKRRLFDRDRIILVGLGAGFIGGFLYWNSSQEKPRRKQKLAKRLHKTVKSAQAAVNLNDFEEATKRYREAMEILKATEEDNSPAQMHNSIALKIVDQLANLSFQLENWDEAEDLFKETLQRMLLAGLAKNDDAFVEVSLKLAKIFKAQDKIPLAENGFKFCIESMDEKIKHMDDIPCNSLSLLGWCLTEYGTFSKETGNLDESERAFSRALTIAKQVLGPTHEQTCVITNDLGIIYDEKGKYKKAANLLEKAIHIAEETSPENLAAYQYNLGEILIHKGDLSRAKAALRKALDLAEANEDKDTMELVKTSIMKLDVDIS